MAGKRGVTVTELTTDVYLRPAAWPIRRQGASASTAFDDLRNTEDT